MGGSDDSMALCGQGLDDGLIMHTYMDGEDDSIDLIYSCMWYYHIKPMPTNVAQIHWEYKICE